jgi:hypothetical protein
MESCAISPMEAHKEAETEGEIQDESEKRSKSVKWRDEAHQDGCLELKGNSPKWHRTDEYWQNVADMRTKSKIARLLASCIALAMITPFCESHLLSMFQAVPSLESHCLTGLSS